MSEFKLRKGSSRDASTSKNSISTCWDVGEIVQCNVYSAIVAVPVCICKVLLCSTTFIATFV